MTTAWGLKSFFTAHPPGRLRADAVDGEIVRIWKEITRLETFPSGNNWGADVALAEVLKADAAALENIALRLKAGRDAIPAYHPSASHQIGDVVSHDNAIWQKQANASGHDNGPNRSPNWTAIHGTPTAPTTTAPQRVSVKTVDIDDFGMAKGAPRKTAEDRGHYQRLLKADQIFAELAEPYVSEITSPPSVRLMLAHLTVLEMKLAAKIEDVTETATELEKRLAAIEEGGIAFKGVFQRASGYQKGAVVTHEGSAWCALRTVPEGIIPGQSATHWQLMVKSGKDGRDAR